jgi:hypothetical protein
LKIRRISAIIAIVRLQRLVIIGGVMLSAVVTVNSLDRVNKQYRNSFLPEDLQKNYYNLEAQALSYIEHQKSNVNGLVESCRGSSRYYYDFENSAFVMGKGGVLDAQTFTYEGGLAIVAYTLMGRESEARKLLEIYRKEFYRPKNDNIGLFTSYKSDIPGENGLTIGIDGDRIHLGPVMWVSIAALQYTAMTGETEFISFAIDTVRWAQHMEHYVFADGEKGGVSMGSGWGPDWSKVYSTENNVDYYAVMAMLKDLFKNGDPTVKRIFKGKNLTYRELDFEMGGVLRWLKETVYDPKNKIFFRGMNENGVDKIKALDTVSWTVAALGPELLTQMHIDPYALMEYSERHFWTKTLVEGKVTEGFDFTDKAGRGSNLRIIWLEGTGQQIISYQVLSDYARRTGDDVKAEEYKEKAIRYAQNLDIVSQAVKLQDMALPYTSFRPQEEEIVTTFQGEWEIPRGTRGQWVSSTASTIWRYFALAAFNPMVFDKDKVTYHFFSTRSEQ